MHFSKVNHLPKQHLSCFPWNSCILTFNTMAYFQIHLKILGYIKLISGNSDLTSVVKLVWIPVTQLLFQEPWVAPTSRNEIVLFKIPAAGLASASAAVLICRAIEEWEKKSSSITYFYYFRLYENKPIKQTVSNLWGYISDFLIGHSEDELLDKRRTAKAQSDYRTVSLKGHFECDLSHWTLPLVCQMSSLK